MDESTKRRLEAFALIGKYLYLISDDNDDDSFFEAQEALNTFKEEIYKLELTPTMKEGVDDFVKYIQTKINKRRREEVEISENKEDLKPE